MNARHSHVPLALAVFLLGSSVGAVPRAPAQPSRPNIVLIITDDQRWDTLQYLPQVTSLLQQQGVTFANAFDPDALCCPSRTSILTGHYSHTTGVYRNDPPYGGFDSFDDSVTIATMVHDAGYRTALIGKYLNGYSKEDAGYIPPGWDRWFARLSEAYETWPVSDQGVLKVVSKYATNALTSRAISFIHSVPPDEPLFLDLAYNAPHKPWVPAPRDVGAFDGIAPYRPPSFNEADVSDKPPYIQANPPFDQGEIDRIDKDRQAQLETLLAVDRGVSSVMATLSDTGRLANTMVVFASDNGLLWGEHRRMGKQAPYEESLRIPMVIRYDPVTAARAGTTVSEPVLNLDLTPTWEELAGIVDPTAEGMSLTPLLAGTPTPWRHSFVLETLDQQVPTYCGARSDELVYVQYGDGFEELYDRSVDPYELQNVAGDPSYRQELKEMRALAKRLCVPVPPGFTWKH